ncbi:DinB family protein [Gottfriedia solisilvae]|uniref:DinB-like domain-containing protein n=1 Tax=Gottfriedia solisilvae TaxID=1516104 RepID=A0A8J3AN93_9BACI|nr:DinB family protein [Gottfriedia solisilvae]GGI17847.1 hypothetical protein GCM10007380_39980 [Gottfriedia solisilvae]
MKNVILRQLDFIRRQTINYVKDMSDQKAKIIPDGLKNNIIWNLGHIYVAQEKFAFQLTGEHTKFPANMNSLFDPGTQPSNWTVEPPTIPQMIYLLNEQLERIELTLADKMNHEIPTPYNSSTGLNFNTVEELMVFCVYHEAMHFAAIKNINALINQ